jgi:hypothetical protein
MYSKISVTGFVVVVVTVIIIQRPFDLTVLFLF